MIMRYMVALLLYAAVPAAIALEQTTAVPAQVQAQPQSPTVATTQDIRGTKTSPLVIFESPEDVADKATAARLRQRDSDSSATSAAFTRVAAITAIAAAAIAFVQAALFVWQLQLMRTSAADASKAALAATAAAESAQLTYIASQRPFMMVSLLEAIRSIQGPPDNIAAAHMNGIFVRASMKNGGPSAAIRVYAANRIEVVDVGAPFVRQAVEHEPHVNNLGPGVAGSIGVLFLPLQAVQRFLAREIDVFYWLRVDYESLTGGTHHTEALFKLEPNVNAQTFWDFRNEDASRQPIINFKPFGVEHNTVS